MMKTEGTKQNGNHNNKEESFPCSAFIEFKFGGNAQFLGYIKPVLLKIDTVFCFVEIGQIRVRLSFSSYSVRFCRVQ